MPDPGGQNKPKVRTRAEQTPPVDRRKAKTRAELLALYKRFYKLGELPHQDAPPGRGGEWRLPAGAQNSSIPSCVLVDGIFNPEGKAPERVKFPFTLVAVGGYGRGTLNPGSDVDLLFLCPGNTSSLSKATVDMIGEILMMLYDVGFKVRSRHPLHQGVSPAGQRGQPDQDRHARYPAHPWGREALTSLLVERFQKECIQGKRGGIPGSPPQGFPFPASEARQDGLPPGTAHQRGVRWLAGLPEHPLGHSGQVWIPQSRGPRGEPDVEPVRLPGHDQSPRFSHAGAQRNALGGATRDRSAHLASPGGRGHQLGLSPTIHVAPDSRRLCGIITGTPAPSTCTAPP